MRALVLLLGVLGVLLALLPLVLPMSLPLRVAAVALGVSAHLWACVAALDLDGVR